MSEGLTTAALREGTGVSGPKERAMDPNESNTFDAPIYPANTTRLPDVQTIVGFCAPAVTELVLAERRTCSPSTRPTTRSERMIPPSR